MLYDSTKALLQSILRSLETGGEIRWDEHTESGNACLYEMHQMARPVYKAYRTDKQNANSQAQTGISRKAQPGHAARPIDGDCHPSQRPDHGRRERQIGPGRDVTGPPQ